MKATLVWALIAARATLAYKHWSGVVTLDAEEARPGPACSQASVR
jgi:hypothetical protein